MHKNNFNVFSKYSNASKRHLFTKKGILAYPRLFVLQFISNKNKVLICYRDGSYHNTSIYLIHKKNIIVLYT